MRHTAVSLVSFDFCLTEHKKKHSITPSFLVFVCQQLVRRVYRHWQQDKRRCRIERGINRKQVGTHNISEDFVRNIIAFFNASKKFSIIMWAYSECVHGSKHKVFRRFFSLVSTNLFSAFYLIYYRWDKFILGRIYRIFFINCKNLKI